MAGEQRVGSTIGRLHVLTDFHFQQRYSHAELAAFAIAGGADTIQFRQKHGAIRHKLRSAEATASVCRKASVPLILDAEIALAMALGAAGVPLGEEDFPIAIARQLLGSGAVIGATAAGLESALLAQQRGADYIGFGPVFATHSKANPAPVKGLEGLREVCRAVSVPVIAIAGITAERIEEVLLAGAHGVAVMTSITNSPDPLRATAEFREKLEKSVQ